MNYSLKHKQGLMEYIKDGRLSMTNSLDERTIRPFEVDRKKAIFLPWSSDTKEYCK